MNPIDILTALVAAGDKATQGRWKRFAAARGAASQVVLEADEAQKICVWPVRSAKDALFIAAAANARPALKAHLAAVARLVEAARRLLNGGDCTCDPAPMGGRIAVCATCEIRAALKEVTS